MRLSYGSNEARDVVAFQADVLFDEQVDLMMFAPGDQVKLDLIAVNAAGESAPIEPVTVTFPLAAVGSR